MNKFTFTSLKFVLFSVFLAMVGILLLFLFLGPCYRSESSAEGALDIPPVIYLSDSDASGSDISGSDLSGSDISGSDISTEVSA